jgi:hypothetical protein
MGLKAKVFDQEFLKILQHILNKRGANVILGEIPMNVMPYMIASLKYNIEGKNAVGKPHRNANV